MTTGWIEFRSSVDTIAPKLFYWLIFLSWFFVSVASPPEQKEKLKREEKKIHLVQNLRDHVHILLPRLNRKQKKGHDQIQNYMSRLKHIRRWFEIKFKPNKTKRNSAQALRSNFKCLLIFWSHSPEDACLSGRRTEGKKIYIYILESKKQLTLNYHAWEVNPPLNNKMKIKPAATTLWF